MHNSAFNIWKKAALFLTGTRHDDKIGCTTSVTNVRPMYIKLKGEHEKHYTKKTMVVSYVMQAPFVRLTYS